MLACDVDSTVWDLSAWLCEAVLDVTGEPLDPEAVNTWTDVLEAYGESAAIEIYTRAHSPLRVREREPYTGARRPCAACKRSATYRYHSQFTHMRGRRFRILLAGGVQGMRFELAGCHKG
jgi:hypothetical protein